MDKKNGEMCIRDSPYRYCNTKRSKSEIYTAENRQAARDVAAETLSLIHISWSITANWTSQIAERKRQLRNCSSSPN